MQLNKPVQKPKSTPKSKPKPRTAKPATRQKPPKIQTEKPETIPEIQPETRTETPPIRATVGAVPIRSILTAAQSAFSVSEEDRDAIRSLTVSDIPDDEAADGQTDGGIITPQDMSGEVFAEFWGVTIWQAGAAVLTIKTGRDCSVVETSPEQRPAAMAAMATLEKIVDRYPAFLGWMKSGLIQDGADLTALFLFAKLKHDAIRVCLDTGPEIDGETVEMTEKDHE